jgi:hypothetical protein
MKKFIGTAVSCDAAVFLFDDNTHFNNPTVR